MAGCENVEAEDALLDMESASDADFAEQDGAAPLALARVSPPTALRAERVGVDVTVDPLAIGQAIAGAVNAAANRGAFVKSAAEAAFYAAKGEANVMVFNMRQDYVFVPDPQTTLFYPAEYNGLTFGVWVFEKAATFRNQGAGTYDNWAYHGYVRSRNGKVVTFNDAPSNDCSRIGVRAECTYRIRVKGDGRFLHEDGGGDKLVSTRYQPNDNYTRFQFLHQSDGSFQIRVKADGRLFHEDGGGDKLVSTRYQPNDNFTRFFLEAQNNGTYRIRVKGDNRYLHEDGGGDRLLSTRWQTVDPFSEFFIDAVR